MIVIRNALDARNAGQPKKTNNGPLPKIHQKLHCKNLCELLWIMNDDLFQYRDAESKELSHTFVCSHVTCLVSHAVHRGAS